MKHSSTPLLLRNSVGRQQGIPQPLRPYTQGRRHSQVNRSSQGHRHVVSVYWLTSPGTDLAAKSLSSDSLEEWQRVEAALLIAKEPMAVRKIAEMAAVSDATRVRTLIKQLNERYDQKGRAFHIKRLAGGYLLMTRPQFGKWIRRLQHVPTNERLSMPALETLAVVAYRQPLVRAEVEAIRGVHSGEVLRQLMERDLVKIIGRSEELGRPFLYATTRLFLKMFGLGSLEELPAAEPLRRSGSSDTKTHGSQTPDTQNPGLEVDKQEQAEEVDE